MPFAHLTSFLALLMNRHIDVPEILAMINELAGFENALDSVQATEASLNATLTFADSPSSTPGYARTMILSSQPSNEVAGMALYFHNYSTWRAKPGIYLEDLFVRPKFRRRGYATVLLKALAGEVRKIDGARLEWACLKWNVNALKFYEGLGAKQMDEWVGLRVDGDELGKLADLEVKKK